MKSIRLFALALGIALIGTFLPWQSHASRDKSMADNRQTTDQTSTTPWLRLDSPKSLDSQNSGLVTSGMQPRSMASGDLDNDGVPDLITGYAAPTGGQVVLRRGNIYALFPNSREAKLRTEKSDDPFLPNGQTWTIKKAADFVGTGDFDADGNWDVVTATRGDRVLLFLKGDGRGELAKPRQIQLEGNVTALTTGDVNRRDGLTDIIVGVQRNDSSSLLIFENATGALQGVPESIPLRSEATSIGVGQLDESYETDLVVASGNDVVFIQGRDRKTSLDAEQRSSVSSPQVSQRTFETTVSSVSVGDFVGDALNEIAVLTVDGNVQVLERGLLSSVSKISADLTSVESKTPGWRNIDTARVSLPPPATNVQNLMGRQLVTAKISSLPKDDLIVIDSDTDQLHYITAEPFNEATDSRKLVSSLSLTSRATAVLPMRLSSAALNSLVVSTDMGSMVVLSPAVGATITVNTNVVTDTRDAVLSLSEAVKVANGTLAFATLTAGEKAQITGTPANPGLDAIHFNIPGATVPTIADNFAIPQITDPVIIDGTTQSAGRVSIEGATGQQSVLRINAGNSTVRGMVLNRSCRGLQLATNGNNVVQGNIIGASIDGLSASGTSCNQIQIDSSTNNTIGGTTAAARNILSGVLQTNNATGINIAGPNATGNLIQGNYIGPDITGNAVIGNRNHGIVISSTCINNTIGGTTAGAGNVISGNGRDNIGGESGIAVSAAGQLIQGNIIGLNKDGTAPLPSMSVGISINSVANITIGGTTPTARNIIAGNGTGGLASHGIALAPFNSTNCLIQGNYIGTNATGTAAARNLGHGVVITGTKNNTVGGAVAGARNLISGNILDGVSIQRVALGEPTDNRVQGNYIGTDATGTVAIPNQSDGISLGEGIGGIGGINLQIGGTTPEARNVISGNRENGIMIRGDARLNPNHYEGNYIGTNAFGTGPLGNGHNGIFFLLNSTDGQQLGGTTAGAGNVIAFNVGDGIASESNRPVGGPIVANSIFSNGGLGIDRGDNGPTANVNTSLDNAPVLTSANTSGNTTTINGTLQQNHTSSVSYTVQFYSNLSCDPSGFGEGQTYIGQTTVNITNNQPVNFTANITPAVPGGRYITAIASGPLFTSANSQIATSEFSFCRQNGGNAPPDQTALRLYTLAPNIGGDIGSVTTLVSGEGIRSGATVRLRKSGQPDIVGTSIEVNSTGTSVSAVLDLTGKAQGVWDVVVTNPNTIAATLPASFTIETGREANVWTDIVGRSKVAVFPAHDERYFVLYGNSGNVDADATFVRFDVPPEMEIRFVEKVNGADPLIGLRDNGNGDFDSGKFIEFYIPKIRANSTGSLLVLLRPAQISAAELTLRASGYTSPSLNEPTSTVVDESLVVTPVMLEQTANSFRMNLNFTSATRNGTVEISGIVTDGPGPQTPIIEKVVEGENITFNITSSVPASFVSSPTQNGFSPSQPEGEKTLFEKIKGTKDTIDALDTANETVQVIMKTLKDKDLNDCLELIRDCNGSPLFSPQSIDRLERAADGTAAAQIGEMAGELYKGPGSQLVEALTEVTSGIMNSSWSTQFIEEACTSNASTTGCNPFRSACDQYAASGGLADVRQVIKESIILRVVDRCSKYQRHVKDHKFIPVTSIDPNDKAGSAGLSDQHYVKGVEPLRYEIMFENLPSATAAAKQVVITDQLDLSKLDIQTFELGTATFGNKVLTPAPGLKAWSTDVDLRPERNVITRLNAELDLNSGIVSWRFTALDPLTGQISTAPEGGFLPPNQTQPEGSGAVFFTVKPKPGLAEGTQINNQARIVFDANPPIDTPVWLNTIDNSRPTSHMTALTPTQSSTDFVINWSGADAGSGVGTYTIYVSLNGGPFEIWADNFTGTTTTFNGLPSTTYRFFSIATDRAGNTESIKGAAEATTVTPAGNPNAVQFSASTYSANESAQVVNVTVTRLGSTTNPATVTFTTSDTASQNCGVVNGNASSRCDYEANLRTIQFAAGETSKTVPILLVNDAYSEGTETFTATLSTPSGVSLGSPGTATVSIIDNDTVNGPNPIDDPGFFVTQHYLDFLNRQPDAAGLAFWTNDITSCGSNQSCTDVKRINVSAAFYLSIEFQQTGYLVERLYKTSYGDATGTSTLGGSHQLPVPIVRLNEFIPDTLQIGQGVVVGQTGWEALLESNKAAFVLQFVQRPRFATAFPTSLTPAQFVDLLFTNAGVTPTTAERQAVIGEFGGAGTSGDINARARAVRRVAEHATLVQQESNKAFVLIQYFGYLRRNPNDAPDSDYTGYDFWLTKLNQFNGNFINAEMVKAFITSIEYRARFGP